MRELKLTADRQLRDQDENLRQLETQVHTSLLLTDFIPPDLMRMLSKTYLIFVNTAIDHLFETLQLWRLT